MLTEREISLITAKGANDIAISSKAKAHSKAVFDILEALNYRIVEEANEGNFCTRTSLLHEVSHEIVKNLTDRGFQVTTNSSGLNALNIEISWRNKEENNS